MGLSPYLMDHGGRPSKITTLKECDPTVVMPERGKHSDLALILVKLEVARIKGKIGRISQRTDRTSIIRWVITHTCTPPFAPFLVILIPKFRGTKPDKRDARRRDGSPLLDCFFQPPRKWNEWRGCLLGLSRRRMSFQGTIERSTVTNGPNYTGETYHVNEFKMNNFPHFRF